MKKLMLGVAVATGLVVAMAGQSLATDLMLCDMNQAIAEAEAAISAVGGTGSTLSDAKGVSIQEHVKYLQAKVEIAREAVATGYAKYPDELYATVTEGTRALKLITGIAKSEAKQVAAPKATNSTSSAAVAAKAAEPKAQTAEPAVVRTAEKAESAGVSVKVTVKPAEDASKTVTAGVNQAPVQAVQAKLAVAKIETGVLGNSAKLASAEDGIEVANPEETAGLDQEIKVPATGEVDTGELEKILMTIGVASAAGMLGLAGILAVIGRR